MRTIYLIRHGHPDFPLNAHVCLGRTDTPLGPLGRMQAYLLGESLRDAGLTTIFTSPLTRCRETAAPLGPEPILVNALAEQDMGPWDGLNFTEIRERWPELYARRGEEPLLVPPGAETLEQVRRRVVPAVEECLRSSDGDIGIVAHASVIQALLAEVCGLPLEESRPLRPPYGSYAKLRYDGALHLDGQKLLPQLPLTPDLAEKLLQAADPGANVAAHSRAVAAETLRIAQALPLALDTQLLHSAALLHDVARREPEHAQLGAAWLRELGYPEAAALVEQHHDFSGEELNEAAILYIADKCIQEDRHVPLAQRFAGSEERCKTPEARAAHARRLAVAKRIQERVNGLCGRQVIN
ncbi:MAG: histidine phosphatase family protein [Oscillospiraceae bacterium]|nr:histidine phosphatase family protein [Oscillospiraceae bacterium]